MISVDCYSSSAITSYEGVSDELRPSFYRFDGTNGVYIPILNSYYLTSQSYYISAWIRPALNIQQQGITTSTIFEIQNLIQCAFIPINLFVCNSTQDQTPIVTQVYDLEYFQWIHVALSGSESKDITYLQIDYPDQLYTQNLRNYMQIDLSQASNLKAYLGISSYLMNGFTGDIREFFFSQNYIPQNIVQNIKNQILLPSLDYIASFRLSNGGVYDSQLGYNAILLNTSTSIPYSVWDSMPNDMCQPFTSSVTLPFLKIKNNLSRQQVTTTKLDSRFAFLTSNYRYSFSIWLKAYPGAKVSSNPYTGNAYNYIFSLDGVFSFFFSNSSAIQTYFQSQLNYLDVFSNSVFFPMRSWANYQIIISQTNGYEIRVYNSQMNIISSTKNNQYLPNQQPTGLYILNNFVGYIRSLLLYQSNTGFPIIPSAFNQKIIDNKMVLYFQFDYQFFSYNTLNALSYNTQYGYPHSINFSIPLDFDSVLFQDYSISQDQTLGTIKQQVNLFDGITCKTQNLTVVTTQANGYMQYDLTNFVNSNQNALTLELWFKRSQISDRTHTIATIYNRYRYNNYMTIQFGADGILRCIPFPFSFNGAPLITIDMGLVDSTYQSWQHVACKFKSYGSIDAQYDNADKIQYFYSVNIFSTNYYMNQGTYSLYVGNNQTQKSGYAGTFFKEVRIWNDFISTEKILHYLYQKVDPLKETKLLYYFQLSAGTAEMFNYLNTTTNSQRNNVGTMIESTLQICPQYTFQRQYQKDGCSKSPFKNANIQLIAEPLSDYPFLQYRLTSQYSDYVNDQYANSFTYQWLISDSTIQTNQVLSQQFNQELILPKDSLNGNQKYTIYLTQTNSYYSFSTKIQRNITTMGCRYLQDSNGGGQIRNLVYYSQPGNNDINIAFQVNTASNSDCGQQSFNNLQQNFDISFSPSSYAPSLYNNYYDSNSKQFKIFIPASAQNSIPFEKTLNVIATVYWQNSGGDRAFLNIIYRIVFAYNIQAVISPKFTNILIGQSAYLDGSNSNIPSLQNSQGQALAGMSFSWSCQFQSCANYSNQKQLVINYQDFLDSGALYNQGYNIQLGVWRSNNFDSIAKNTASITLVWRNVQVAQFTIIQSSKNILASSDNVFYVQISNYATDDPNLSIKWYVTPPLNNGTQLIQNSSDQSQIKILAGAMNFSSFYTLKALIINKEYSSESAMTQSVSFSTGNPPSSGTVIATPSSGTFLQTQFYFSINGWISQNAPVMFKVYGQQSSSSPLIKLTQSWVKQGQTFNTTLPTLINAIFYITDQGGEIIQVSAPIVVYMTNTASFPTLAINATKIPTIENKYLTFNFIIQQMNYQQSNGQSVDTQGTLIPILNNINQDLSYATPYNVSNTTYELIVDANSVLPSILSNSQNVNQQIVQLAFQIIQSISTPTTLFQQAISDPDFSQNYANTLSLLFNYTNSQQNGNRRILQSTPIDINTLTILQQMQNFTDLQCSIMNQTQTLKMISTQTFDTVIELFDVAANDLSSLTVTYTNNDRSQQQVVPVKDIIQQLLSQNNSNIKTVCIQTFFIYTNIFKSYSFSNQQYNLNLVMKTNSVDNLGNHLISSGQLLSSSLSNTYNPTFSYDYSNPSLNFSSNYTSCAQIDSSGSQNQWSSASCTTNFYYSQRKIQCQCNKLGSYFYSIVNDYTKIITTPNISNVTQNVTTNRTNSTDQVISQKPIMNFSLVILAVIIALAFFDIYLGITAIINDKRDYEDIKVDRFEIDEEFLKKLAFVKKTPLESLQYKKRIISEFMNVEHVSFGFVFCLFLRQLHPLFNIFYKFDIEIKRLLRAMIVLYQICIIAIICTLIFGTAYRTNEQQDADGKNRENMDSKDLGNAIISGILLSLLTLPIPNWFLSFMKTKLVIETDLERQFREEDKKDMKTGKKKKKVLQKNKEIEDKTNPNTNSRIKSNEDDDEIRKSPKKNHQAYEGGEEDEEQDFDAKKIDEPITAIDNCIPLKILLILLSQLLLGGTIAFLILTSSNVPKAQSICIVVSWFIAVFGGWLLLNILRLLLIAKVIPKDGSSSKCLNCFIIPSEGNELLQDIINIYEINNRAKGKRSSVISEERGSNKEEFEKNDNDEDDQDRQRPTYNQNKHIQQKKVQQDDDGPIQKERNNQRKSEKDPIDNENNIFSQNDNISEQQQQEERKSRFNMQNQKRVGRKSARRSRYEDNSQEEGSSDK